MSITNTLTRQLAYKLSPELRDTLHQHLGPQSSVIPFGENLPTTSHLKKMLSLSSKLSVDDASAIARYTDSEEIIEKFLKDTRVSVLSALAHNPNFPSSKSQQFVERLVARKRFDVLYTFLMVNANESDITFLLDTFPTTVNSFGEHLCKSMARAYLKTFSHEKVIKFFSTSSPLARAALEVVCEKEELSFAQVQEYITLYTESIPGAPALSDAVKHKLFTLIAPAHVDEWKDVRAGFSLDTDAFLLDLLFKSDHKDLMVFAESVDVTRLLTKSLVMPFMWTNYSVQQRQLILEKVQLSAFPLIPPDLVEVHIGLLEKDNLPVKATRTIVCSLTLESRRNFIKKHGSLPDVPGLRLTLVDLEALQEDLSAKFLLDAVLKSSFARSEISESLWDKIIPALSTSSLRALCGYNGLPTYPAKRILSGIGVSGEVQEECLRLFVSSSTLKCMKAEDFSVDLLLSAFIASSTKDQTLLHEIMRRVSLHNLRFSESALEELVQACPEKVMDVVSTQLHVVIPYIQLPALQKLIISMPYAWGNVSNASLGQIAADYIALHATESSRLLEMVLSLLSGWTESLEDLIQTAKILL